MAASYGGQLRQSFAGPLPCPLQVPVTKPYALLSRQSPRWDLVCCMSQPPGEPPPVLGPPKFPDAFGVVDVIMPGPYGADC